MFAFAFYQKGVGRQDVQDTQSYFVTFAVQLSRSNFSLSKESELQFKCGFTLDFTFTFGFNNFIDRIVLFEEN